VKPGYLRNGTRETGKMRLLWPLPWTTTENSKESLYKFH
jgi:hypothetical protein